MSLLFRVVYAAHANGTHHKLALDALQRLTLAEADAWRGVFLKHVTHYLEGSKAPDTTFKDFKNHVLHPRDKYWGGAPEKVASWYRHLVAALKDRDWQQAVWCAGVLSHYFTDPIHPFHTAQSEAENNIHRAVEWSINRSYDLIRREAEAQNRGLMVSAPGGHDWLKTFVCESADKANAHYEKLIAHYDFNIGVVDPPAGLDEIAREVVGDLVLYAADAFARVLERAIAESGVSPPQVSLTLDTLVATLQIPRKWLEKRLANAEDRRIVTAMYDELMATGRVERALPEDDRVVRDVHAREVLAARAHKQAERRAERMAGPVVAVRTTEATARPPAASAGTAAPTLPTAGPMPVPTTLTARLAAVPAATAAAASVASPQSAIAGAAREPAPHVDSPPAAPQRVHAGEPRSIESAASSRTRAPRTFLAMHDDVEAAPSIGPKTAARLYAAGVRTVGDLMEADPFALSEALGVRHITPETIADWQDQAHLVMAIAGLRGGQAQLLVGAGYHSVEAISNADPAALSAAILKFVTTEEGRRILREGEVPDLERIKAWVETASAALAA